MLCLIFSTCFMPYVCFTCLFKNTFNITLIRWTSSVNILLLSLVGLEVIILIIALAILYSILSLPKELITMKIFNCQILSFILVRALFRHGFDNSINLINKIESIQVLLIFNSISEYNSSSKWVKAKGE